MVIRERDAPGIRVIPPVIYAGFLAVGIALDYFLPIPLLPATVQYPVGSALILASVLIVLSALREFRKARTSFDVRKPATALVMSGLFRFSRNPGYLALTLLYTGIAVAADSIWILALLVPILVVMHYGVIVREERYLYRHSEATEPCVALGTSASSYPGAVCA